MRDEKELEELIRKIYSPAEQLEHYLLDKELLVLHCFPLASVLLHTPAKMYLATLRNFSALLIFSHYSVPIYKIMSAILVPNCNNFSEVEVHASKLGTVRFFSK